MKKIYVALAVSTLALSACGGHLESTTDGGSSATSVSATVAPSETGSNSYASPSAAESTSATSAAASSAPATSASAPASSATPSPTRTVTVTTDETVSAAPSMSSSENATNDLANAIQIPLQKSQGGGDYPGYASITTPSGNIACSISASGDSAYCGVMSWAADKKYPVPGLIAGQTAYGTDMYLSGDHAFQPFMRSDAPDYRFASITAEYGNTYTYGDFACDSEETGLTCWNTKTGQGALLNRDGYQMVNK